MKYLLTQFLILIVSVILLLYFFSLSYFLPQESGNVNWYNVSTVIFLAFFLIESLIALIIYLTEKFLAYGWKEFPNEARSLKWGLSIGLCVAVALVLSMFNIMPLFYAFLTSVIILCIFNILKIF